MEIVPTMIESFDLLIGGGFRRGNTVLLMGDFQAGQEEFLYTCVSRLGSSRKRLKNLYVPKGAIWATLMKLGSDIESEVKSKFTPEFSESFLKNVVFEDFFEEYISEASILPTDIIREMETKKKVKTVPKDLEDLTRSSLTPASVLLDSLAKMFREKAKDVMVVVDSLTDLCRVFRSPDEWNDLLLFLHWLKRSSRKWGGIIYTIFTTGTVDERREKELLPCFDNVLMFKTTATPQGEQKTLSVKKFSGEAARGDIGEVRVIITNNGLDVEKLKLIERLA
jgi:KaiC/GvpD/RAD55 family RecA-like ATPase